MSITEPLNYSQPVTAFVAAVGGAFALWRWMVDQKWRRVQYAQALIQRFLEKKNTIKAFEILDTVGDVECDDESHPKKKTTIDITDKFLIGALSTFDQKEENDDDEITIRNILDAFFDELSTFQSHIEADLIKLQDIQPYLEYWMIQLAGRGQIHGSDFARQVAKYLDFFGYKRVLTLAKNMGHPIS